LESNPAVTPVNYPKIEALISDAFDPTVYEVRSKRISRQLGGVELESNRAWDTVNDRFLSPIS
jgi:hypothetical protein